MSVVEELNYLVTALETAVRMDFMARPHAALIWKKLLKGSGLDVVQTNNTEVNKNVTTKKS